jgi:hypothetical protein
MGKVRPRRRLGGGYFTAAAPDGVVSDSPPTSLARRHFLAAAGIAGLTGLAGCSLLNGDQSSPTTGQSTATPTERGRSGYGAGGYGERGYGSSG